MNKPTGQILAKKGFSKLFTCDVVAAWVQHFGPDPMSIDDLLNDGATSYILLRAAGVNNPMFGRTRAELQRVDYWCAYFSKNPMPTHDGADNFILTPGDKENTWVLEKVMAIAA